ncbi:MFS transporter [Streptoalloteichus hindustanus]|uniref:Predicted arabinose efflux permease, MFS family n=1 Tax=Streptoalloteichus hindustanus TaxID=2017 RepID=A0A1M5LTW6_STRHI|nr:MFS transporter [Streptoalloteichus hindustanus]SHG67823.1 Predicted arabinose efflux permease, MFS family [Streptoalloteichus hindustanus]
MPAYLVAATLTRLASEMLPLTVVLLVLDRGGGESAAGWTVAAYTLPAVVSGPLLGAWLDRTRHTRAALAANQVLLAVAALGLLASAGRAPAAAVSLAVLAGVASPMTSGGFSSLVPRIARGRESAVVTAWDAATFNAAAIAGPALAGTLSATVNAGSAMAVTAVCALAGLAGTALLAFDRPHDPADRTAERAARPSSDGSGRPRQSPPPPLLASVVAGTRHLLRTPPLLGATATTVLGFGSTGLLTLALPLHLRNLGAEAGAAGWVWAALEVGCAASTLVLARWIGARRPENVVFASTAGYGLALVLWPLAPTPALLVVAGVVTGLVEGPTLPAVISARRAHTPPEMLAQVHTTGASLKVGAYALGAAIGARLVPELGSSATLGIVAGCQVVAALVGWSLARTRSGKTRTSTDNTDRNA